MLKYISIKLHSKYSLLLLPTFLNYGPAWFKLCNSVWYDNWKGGIWTSMSCVLIPLFRSHYDILIQSNWAGSKDLDLSGVSETPFTQNDFNFFKFNSLLVEELTPLQPQAELWRILLPSKFVQLDEDCTWLENIFQIQTVQEIISSLWLWA